MSTTLWLATLGVTGVAMANKTDGQIQIGVTTPVYTVTRWTDVQEINGEDEDTAVSGSEWGFRNQVTGELGYGVSKYVVLGAMFQLGGGTETMEPDYNDTEVNHQFYEMMIGPKLDVMLRPGKAVRPLIGLSGGYASSWSTHEETMQPDEDVSARGFRIIGTLGARLFLAKNFSFDPAFVFNYRRDSRTLDVGGGEFDVTRKGYQMGLVFGFSGWL